MEMKKKESGNFSGGFTLIELLIVISLMGILLGLATPSFIEWRKNLQYKEAAEGVLSTLRTAKSNAVSLNLQNRVEIQPGSSRYRITQGNRSYDSTTWNTVKQDWVTLPDGVLLWNGNCASSTDVNVNIPFSPNGTASASTVCVKDNGSAKYEIIVATSGRIRNVKQ